VINQWDDFVDSDRLEWCVPPVFSCEEVEAMKRFHGTWQSVADATSRLGDPLEEIQKLAEWERLRDAAAAALSVFGKRGKLPEEQEIAQLGV
jgi:hypothetical protein